MKTDWRGNDADVHFPDVAAEIALLDGFDKGVHLVLLDRKSVV